MSNNQKHEKMKKTFKTSNGTTLSNGWMPKTISIATQTRYLSRIKHESPKHIIEMLMSNAFDIAMNTNGVSILVYYKTDIVKNFHDCPVFINDYGHTYIWIASRIKLVLV